METQRETQPSAPVLQNTYYETAPDGTEYFCCGKNRIQVSEHFAASGKHPRLHGKPGAPRRSEEQV